LVDEKNNGHAKKSQDDLDGFSLEKFKPDSEMGVHGRLRDRVHALYLHGSPYAMVVKPLDFIVGRPMILAMEEKLHPLFWFPMFFNNLGNLPFARS